MTPFAWLVVAGYALVVAALMSTWRSPEAGPVRAVVRRRR
jgi:hypothetical protein